jgi:hypothetical protein
MMGALRLARDVALIAWRLSYITLVCLPVILVDEALRNRRMKRRPR